MCKVLLRIQPTTIGLKTQIRRQCIKHSDAKMMALEVLVTWGLPNAPPDDWALSQPPMSTGQHPERLLCRFVAST